MPDPKTGARIVDPDARRRKLAADPICRVCGARPTNAHHLLPKGRGKVGDDVEANLIPVCGSGASGCHGALHGATYHDQAGRRWDMFAARQRIGMTLRRDEGQYLVDKLGMDAAVEYGIRHYHVDLRLIR